MSKTIADLRIETRILANRLKEAKVGDVVPYAELSKLIGSDVQNKSRHLLASAKRVAERDEKCLFSIVRKSGVKRLAPGEQPGEIDLQRVKIRKSAKRALRRSKHVNWSELNESERSQLNATRTLLYFTAQSTADKKLEDTKVLTEKTGQEIAFQKMLEHFKE